jgi:alanyl-tRNA synthetase
MKKMDPREAFRVEELVNEYIRKDIPVNKEVKDIDAARREGATALFGEKYDKTVRVVTVGGISKELCGGTHIHNTGQIGIFRITSESSIASGIRRIEALTGKAAEEWLAIRKKAEESRLKSDAEKEELKKLAEERIEEETSNIGAFIDRAKMFGKARLVIEKLGDIGIEGLRIISDRVRQKAASAVVILVTVSDGKISFVVSATDDIIKKGVSANILAKEMAGYVNGSGGGRDAFAQGGGKAPDGLDGAMSRVTEILKEKLS